MMAVEGWSIRNLRKVYGPKKKINYLKGKFKKMGLLNGQKLLNIYQKGLENNVENAGIIISEMESLNKHGKYTNTGSWLCAYVLLVENGQ